MLLERIKELLSEKKYSLLRKELEDIYPADLVTCLEELDSESLLLVFRLLAKDHAAETFSYMEPELQEKLITIMTDQELSEVMSKLFLDDTIDLIEEMPAIIVKRILKNSHEKQRKLINEFLNYPPDSAGSLMTIEFIDLKCNQTIEQAFERIRKIGYNKETIYTCYVLDNSRKLMGIVTVKDLLLAEKDALVSDIMETNPITVQTLEDKEEVASIFRKYDFITLPVVDNENRLVGIITIDDVVDVIQEENTEDFEKMAAMTPYEDSYFRTSVLKQTKNRITWLLILMLSATVTGIAITKYEKAFEALPLLVAFIPMLMDTGGNCGAQSSTLIIRGMAMEEIHLKDFLKVIWKEARIALLVGITLGIINGIRIYFQYNNIAQNLEIAFVIGCSLLCTVLISKIIGCILPMIAKVLKLDPAIMAAPLITTIVDTCSIFIYFNIATAILHL